MKNNFSSITAILFCILPLSTLIAAPTQYWNTSPWGPGPKASDDFGPYLAQSPSESCGRYIEGLNQTEKRANGKSSYSLREMTTQIEGRSNICKLNLHFSGETFPAHSIITQVTTIPCEAPKIPDSKTGKCVLPCNQTSQLSGECHKPPEEKHCGGKSSNPIDFSSAEKLRNEHVITAGTRDPLSFKLYYNNHTNNEKTAAGIVAHQAVPSTVLSTSTPIPPNNFAANYNQKGLLKSTVLANQYYGGIEQYWRHNYDDVLQIRGGVYQLHLANGQVRDFDGLGQSKTHPVESLLALNVNEESFTGYKWVNHKTGNEKRFDNTGKLRKIITAASESTTLMYTNEQLTRIENQYGEYLAFEYTAFNTNSIYSTDDTTHALPTKVTGSNGRSASLGWNANF